MFFFSGGLLFVNVFLSSTNIDRLQTSLEVNNRWFKVGEALFNNDSITVESRYREDLKKIRHDKFLKQNKVFLNNLIGTKKPNLTWQEFKEGTSLDGLNNLTFDEKKGMSDFCLKLLLPIPKFIFPIFSQFLLQ